MHWACPIFSTTDNAALLAIWPISDRAICASAMNIIGGRWLILITFWAKGRGVIAFCTDNIGIEFLHVAILTYPNMQSKLRS
jgi:hypothetical protein